MSASSSQLNPQAQMGAFSRAKDLHKKILFVLIALIVYRLGTFVPIPGINSEVFQEIFSQNSGGLLGMFDMFVGGAVQRMSIFALGVMPYISATIKKRWRRTGQTKNKSIYKIWNCFFSNIARLWTCSWFRKYGWIFGICSYWTRYFF